MTRSEAEDYYQRGLEAYNKSDFITAIDYFDTALPGFPVGSYPTDWAKTHLALGKAYHSLGNSYRAFSDKLVYYLKIAILHYNAALKVLGVGSPEYGKTQEALSVAHQELLDEMDLENKIRKFQEKWRILATESYPRTDRDEARKDLVTTRQKLMGDLKNLQSIDKLPYTGFLARRSGFYSILLLLVICGSFAVYFLFFDHPFKTCSSGSIKVGGSTALYPLVQTAQKEYELGCKENSPMIDVSLKLQTGSLNGLAQVENGDVTIGASDVYANEKDLVDHQVAIVVFALVINKSFSKITKITNLNTTQIRAIYNGEVNTNTWGDVTNTAGQGSSFDIIRISRPATSGTRAAFEKFILGGVETISGPEFLISDTSEDVANSVCNTPGAIGYVSLYYAYAHAKCLTILSIDHVKPTLDSVKNNTYQFWQIEHLYTKGEATGLTKAFIDYFYSDDVKKYLHLCDIEKIGDATKCISPQYDQYGYLDITEIAPSILANH